MTENLSTQLVTQTLTTEQDSQQGVAPLQFIQVPDYTTFKAEFALTEGDIIFHFFMTPEVEKLRNVRVYWANTFPGVLEPVAKKIFNAEYPRIKAQHVHDAEMKIDSWWFRAYGFGHLLDPDALAYRFLDALDAGIEAEMKK